MQELIINKKILTVMFGFFLIGGAATILGIYRAVKDAEPPLGNLMEERDENIFV